LKYFLAKSVNAGSTEGMNKLNTTCPEPVQSTPDTQPTLLELEAIVEKGLRTYQSVGAALDHIHSRKLYKPQYKSFKAYLAERWRISRAHSYRLMSAAITAKMSPAGDKPKSERQANKRTDKPKAEKISKIVFDLELEYQAFLKLVARWDAALSRDDYRTLIERVESHVENIVCEFKAEVEVAP
jgi:hypothetical protein